MKNEIRILIADDHPIFRKGLRQIIESDPSLKIAAEAEDGESALEQIQTCRPWWRCSTWMCRTRTASRSRARSESCG